MQWYKDWKVEPHTISTILINNSKIVTKMPTTVACTYFSFMCTILFEFMSPHNHHHLKTAV
jgi:hypothetical protein